MKTFKNLIIKDSKRRSLKEILHSVISELPPDWKFRGDFVENYANNLSKDKSEIGCFESPEISNKKGLVWFVIWDKELKIVNIVPTLPGSLSHDEYNEILDRFKADCIDKVISGDDAKITKTDGIYDIEQIAGAKTYRALYKWEGSCNHSTGNTHPMDFERWADFVCIAHFEKSKLTPNLLQRWLTEQKNWNDDDLVSKIVIDFEYGLSILDHYVKNS